MTSIRRLQARLDRVAEALASASKVVDDAGFPIDLAVAIAIETDHLKLTQLQHESRSKKPGDTASADLEQEISKLEASIADKVRGIPCPASYGEQQYNRESLIRSYQMIRRGATDAELAKEKALSLARRLAYLESPEAHGRARISQLSGKTTTAAEKNELEALLLRYPKVPLDPDHPRFEAMKAWEAALKNK